MAAAAIEMKEAAQQEVPGGGKGVWAEWGLYCAAGFPTNSFYCPSGGCSSLVVLRPIRRVKRGLQKGLKQRVQQVPFHEQRRVGLTRGVGERGGQPKRLLQGWRGWEHPGWSSSRRWGECSMPGGPACIARVVWGGEGGGGLGIEYLYSIK